MACSPSPAGAGPIPANGATGSRPLRGSGDAEYGHRLGRNYVLRRKIIGSKSMRICDRGCVGNEAPMVHERIEINPDIMGGKPVIKGTRVPVETVLRKLGSGMSVEAILADHPRLTRDDVLAAQAFAADYLADEDLVYG